MVDAGASAERAAEVAGPDLDLLGKREQALVKRAIDLRGPVGRLDRQVGPGDIADEEAVPADDGPRLLAPLEVEEQERGVLGPMAGCRDGFDSDLAEIQRPAVADRAMLVLGLGKPVNVDRRSGRQGQPAVSGDVVGVVVGFEHVLDPGSVQTAEPQVGIDVPLRVDHGGDPGARSRRPGRTRSRDPRGRSAGTASGLTLSRSAAWLNSLARWPKSETATASRSATGWPVRSGAAASRPRWRRGAAAEGTLGRVAAAGAAGHALDFDDTYLPGLAHLSAANAPVALVLGAERDLSIGEAGEAFAAGFEAMGAVARASHPALYDGGWHPTAVCGVVGAAVCASRLLGLDRDRERAGMALALLRSGGLRSAFGSHGKSLQVGMAAAAGRGSRAAGGRGRTGRSRPGGRRCRRL